MIDWDQLSVVLNTELLLCWEVLLKNIFILCMRTHHGTEEWLSWRQPYIAWQIIFLNWIELSIRDDNTFHILAKNMWSWYNCWYRFWFLVYRSFISSVMGIFCASISFNSESWEIRGILSFVKHGVTVVFRYFWLTYWNYTGELSFYCSYFCWYMRSDWREIFLSRTPRGSLIPTKHL